MRIALVFAVSISVCGSIMSGAVPLQAQNNSPLRIEERNPADLAADLALEEAELRDRFMTALIIAVSVRLRGRTLAAALPEIRRIRRELSNLPIEHPKRWALEKRLDRLEIRYQDVSARLDEDFEVYTSLVAQLSENLWSRVRRIGENLKIDFAELELNGLTKLMPVLQEHVQELSRVTDLTPTVKAQWRKEIDDTYSLREQGGQKTPDPPKKPVSSKEDDQA